MVSDGVGTLYGRFSIPNTETKRFRIGRRTFRLTDSPTDVRTVGFVNTSAEEEYFAMGHKQTKQELIMATRNASITRTQLQETSAIFTRSGSSSSVGAW